jgi:ubiquinone/menaquinone biosynthesis C-methylase UbiE
MNRKNRAKKAYLRHAVKLKKLARYHYGFQKYSNSLISDYVRSHLKGKKILEVGCFQGNRTKLLYQHSNRVTGVDLVNRVKKAHKGKFKFVKADVCRLPFKDQAFDAVFLVDVIEHIKNDRQAAKELFRVLKKGGVLIIITPNRARLSNRLYALMGKKITYPYKLDEIQVHVREYTMTSLRRLIKKAGFKIISEKPIWLGFVGLIGPIDLGLKTPPKVFNSFSQSLFMICQK